MLLSTFLNFKGSSGTFEDIFIRLMQKPFELRAQWDSMPRKMRLDNMESLLYRVMYVIMYTELYIVLGELYSELNRELYSVLHYL